MLKIGPAETLVMRKLFLFALLVLGSPAHSGETWPGWRGPSGQGVTDEKELPLTWGGKSSENVLWKVLLPGADGQSRLDLNQSSPIIGKDRVFVTAAFWPPGVDKTEFPEHRVACYRLEDGKKLWDVEIKPGPWQLKDLRGGYAAPTPATDGERVYVLFGSSVLAALDFEGKLVWRKEVAPHAWDVAIGTSPVLYKETVLVLADGTRSDQSRLIAFDKKSGEVAWQQPRPKASFSHSTPLLIEVANKPQLVVASSSELQGLNPADGKPIWWVTVKGDVPTPAFGNGLVYSENGRGGPAVAVDPSGEGDVTRKLLKWTSKPIPEGYGSPTIVGDYVYRVHNPGVLKCLSLATGEVVYSERLPMGVDPSVSPIRTPGNRLYFAGGGKSVVVQAGPKFELLATNDLNDGGPASPAAAKGRLVLKGAKHLYCVGKK